MHTASKILLKLVFSLVYMTALGLIVNFEPTWTLRLVYCIGLGVGFMVAEMIIWPVETTERSGLARTVWKRCIMVLIKSFSVAIGLVGLLVVFATGDSRFVVIEDNFLMVNTNYLIAYFITWLLMLIVTNVLVVN